jgi:hypothetical protein
MRLSSREHLLVSNTGPKGDGYSYCAKCGYIEASSDPTPLLSARTASHVPTRRSRRVRVRARHGYSACPRPPAKSNCVLTSEWSAKKTQMAVRENLPIEEALSAIHLSPQAPQGDAKGAKLPSGWRRMKRETAYKLR